MDAARERACLICGCTEARACVTEAGPCAWVAGGDDLCTACLEAAEPHALALITIGRERGRQVSAEGYDEAHDDRYRNGQLCLAAAYYARVAANEDFRREYPPSHPPALWPWAPEYWKPKDPVSDLVRAGALIVAELERRMRAGEAERESHSAGGQA